MNRILPAILFAAALALPAQAQVRNTQPDGFKVLSAQDIAKLLDKPANGASPIAAFVSDHENYYVEFVTRVAPGEVEVHPHWIDYMSIQSGEATLTYGGTVSGNRDTGAGEMRGGTQAGGTSVDLKPGSYVAVPAGMPHVMVPKGKVTYLIFKVRQ
jgi:mannose-6-phosphate isomerase-like protein (cupin superfamily)